MGRHIDVLEEYDGFSSVFIACNRGKRSVTLDLRTAGGKRAFLRLTEIADVLLSNFKLGTLDEWGLGYDELAAVNPRIIWAAGSYLGAEGPDAQREGADIVGQASGGIVFTSGFDGDLKAPASTLVADHSGSQNFQTGILAALYAREKSGRGQKVEVSLLGGQIRLQAAEYTHCLLTGEEPGRSNGGHPLINLLCAIFPTQDGHIAIAGCPEHLWPGMVRAVEHPELLETPRFGQYIMSPEVREELFEVFREIFRERTTAEWCERLSAEALRKEGAF